MPIDLPDTVSTPSYFCKRWYSADREKVLAYILICLDTNPEPRLNLHHHCEAGVFSLWIDGEWKVRIAKYTGFDLAANTESRAVAENLPEGALLPAWRVTGGDVVCDPLTNNATERHPGLLFQWGDRAVRYVTWGPLGVTLHDNSTVRTWDLPQ